MEGRLKRDQMHAVDEVAANMVSLTTRKRLRTNHLAQGVELSRREVGLLATASELGVVFTKQKCLHDREGPIRLRDL